MSVIVTGKRNRIFSRGRIAIVIAAMSLIGAGGGRVIMESRAVRDRYDPALIRAEADVKSAALDLVRRDYAAADFHFTRAFSIVPSDSYAVMWGRSKYYLGDLPGAAALFERASIEDAGLAGIFLDRIRGMMRPEEDVEPPERWRIIARVADEAVTPVGVTGLSTGNVAVSDEARGEILWISPSGEIVGRAGGLDHPRGIASAGGNQVWVAEFGADRLSRVGPDGRIEESFGSTGSGPGEFHGPSGVAIDSWGDIYVSDLGNGRIERFRSDGSFAAEYGPGGGIVLPPGLSGIDVMEDGTILAAAAEGKEVFSLNPATGLMRRYTHPLISFPVDVMARGGRIFVADEGGGVFFGDLGGELEGVMRSPSGETIQGGEALGLAFDQHGYLYIAGEGRVLCIEESPRRAPPTNLEIFNLDTDDYPTIRMRTAVTDMNGDPIAGLNERNFRVVDGGEVAYPLSVLNMNEIEGRRMICLVEKSDEMVEHELNLSDIVGNIVGALEPSDRMALWEVGDTLVVRRGMTSLGELVMAALNEGRPAPIERLVLEESLDLALERMRTVERRPAVILAVSGEGWDADELNNRITPSAVANHIPVFVIDFGPRPNPALERLARASGGGYYSVYRPPSTRDLVRDLSSMDNPYYSLAFEVRDPRETVRGDEIAISVELYLRGFETFDRLYYVRP